MDQVAIWVPLAVGGSAVAVTIFIHALAVNATVNFVRHEVRAGRAGAGFWTDVAIVVAVIVFALAAHLVEIAVWALLFVVCGEFPTFAAACYHSAVNYTTLGYGDIVMTASWKFLGPLEAANGMLLFGVSTARLIRDRDRLQRVVSQLESDAQRKIAVAASPSPVRTPCNPPHFSMSARLSGPALAKSVAINLPLVGMMTKRVYGQFATRTPAPSSQRQSAVCHHVATPTRNPMTASEACIAYPRL
jgi:hypothetical protein